MKKPMTYAEAIAAVEEALQSNADEVECPIIRIKRIDARRNDLSVMMLARQITTGFAAGSEIEIDASLVVYPPPHEPNAAPIVGSPTPAEPIMGRVSFAGTLSIDIPMKDGRIDPVDVAQSVNWAVWEIAQAAKFDADNAATFWRELRGLLAVDAHATDVHSS